MKKVIILIALLVSGVMISQAQVNPKTIGLRFGGSSLSGAEFSYQHGMGEKNRIELDLGGTLSTSYNRATATASFQWDFNIIAGFNWFVGPGAQVSFNKWVGETAYIGVGVGAQGGIEYDFSHLNVPIMVSLDLRPMYDILGAIQGHGGVGLFDSGLGIRYTFQ